MLYLKIAALRFVRLVYYEEIVLIIPLDNCIQILKVLSQNEKQFRRLTID